MKVLIVDDSALMRRWLKQCLEDTASEIEIARSGKDALAKIGAFQPDVVTLDINMPEMDGLTCLAHIMTDHPCPVVMVSSLTAKGAMATLEALELGAVDFFEKPSGTVSHDLQNSFPEILAKVKAAARARLRRKPQPTPTAPKPVAAAAQRRTSMPTRPTPFRKTTAKKPTKLVMFGVSTGGPNTVERVLEGVSSDLAAPILVAIHMPSRFTQVYADRLTQRLGFTVKALSGSVPLVAGEVVVAGADSDVCVSMRAGRLVAVQTPIDPERVWHPSVDRMVETAMACIAPDSLVGVQLTGMGDDGARAMAELNAKGGFTIAESETSAVIFGMPKELIARGGASQILDADDVSGVLNSFVGVNVPASRQMQSVR